AVASTLSMELPLDTGRPRKGRWLEATAVSIALAGGGGLWATRQSLPGWLHRHPNNVVPALEAKASPLEPASSHRDPSPSAPTEQPALANTVPADTPAAVLQMATFQSSTRTQQAIQELANAGFRAYSVELPAQDGERRLTVLLGPYAERSAAERDLDAV